MTWIYLVIGAIFSSFAFLTNYNHGSNQIASITFFSLTYIFSFVFLIMLPFMSQMYGTRVRGSDGVRPFWLQNLTLGKLAWVPIGVVGVFAMAYLSVGLQSPIIGIFLSGVIMMICFFRTHSILVPILIHGIYNAVIVVLQAGIFTNSFLSTAPTSVPLIGVSLVAGSQLTSEMIFQFVLVATTEELLKMLIIAFFIVNIKGTFDSKGILKYFGAVTAIIIWSVLHLIVALPATP